MGDWTLHIFWWVGLPPGHFASIDIIAVLWWRAEKIGSRALGGGKYGTYVGKERENRTEIESFFSLFLLYRVRGTVLSQSESSIFPVKRRLRAVSLRKTVSRDHRATCDTCSRILRERERGGDGKKFLFQRGFGKLLTDFLGSSCPNKKVFVWR